MTYGELVYMVIDELKLLSDDSYFNEDHIIFLADKYRLFLLDKKYSKNKTQIPESNYQTLCVDLEPVISINYSGCENLEYLKSVCKIPHIYGLATPRVSSQDFFKGAMLSYVSKDRLEFVGNNRYTNNFIFASIGDDNYLYLKSSNPQYSYLDSVKITGIFEDSKEATEYACNKNIDNCSILEQVFPIEGALVNAVIELVVKELFNSLYKPEDNKNDSKDSLGDLGVAKAKSNE